MTVFTTADVMILVDNLRPFTSYTFTIAASTVVGLGPLSTAITETTPEDGTAIHGYDLAYYYYHNHSSSS